MDSEDDEPREGYSESELIQAAEGLSFIEDALGNQEDSDLSMLDREEIPAEFDGLVLKERIGFGGMGEVYLAHQKDLNRDVAVKIRVSRSSDAPFADRLILNEAQTLAELDHPGVAQVHSVGEVAGRRYLVMEHIRGRSLAEHMGRSMSIGDATQVLLGVSRALAAAHSRSLPHRDLKPSNILLVDAESDEPLADRVRLIDFGLSGRLFDIGGSAQMGTRRYMAPEQREGRAAGTEADIYALRQTFGELVEEDWLQIPGRTRRILRGMSAQKPEDRPTAAEVAADLEAHLSSRGSRRWSRLASSALLILAAAITWGASQGPFDDSYAPEMSATGAQTEPSSQSEDDLFDPSFQRNRKRFMLLLGELEQASPGALPISDPDLRFLKRRAPDIHPAVYNRVRVQLDRFGVQLAPNRKGKRGSSN